MTSKVLGAQFLWHKVFLRSVLWFFLNILAFYCLNCSLLVQLVCISAYRNCRSLNKTESIVKKTQRLQISELGGEEGGWVSRLEFT